MLVTTTTTLTNLPASKMVTLLFQCDGWKTTMGVSLQMHIMLPLTTKYENFYYDHNQSTALTNTIQCIANIVDDNPILIKASDLQDNFLDLTDLNLLPTWNSGLYAS